MPCSSFFIEAQRASPSGGITAREPLPVTGYVRYRLNALLAGELSNTIRCL